MTFTDLYAVHLEILEEAVEIANRLVDEDPMPIKGGFRAVPNKDALTLEMDPLTPEAYRSRVRELGVKGVHDAIVKKGSLFAGLIVGAARDGGRYLDDPR